MPPVTIDQWKNLQARKWHSLLLGNGASMALHRGFGYSSLHQVAVAAGKLGLSNSVFDELKTKDFEHVLLACWHANIVNTALGTPSPIIAQAYVEVREALIAAVHHIHCSHSSVLTQLAHIAFFAKQFHSHPIG